LKFLLAELNFGNCVSHKYVNSIYEIGLILILKNKDTWMEEEVE